MHVFYSQKTEEVIKKIELPTWRHRIKEKLDDRHQKLSDIWLSCALGKHIGFEGKFLKNVKDLTPDVIKLGCDFSVAVQEKNNDIELQIIEKIHTIWRDDIK
jgi:hypothetical protein